MELVLSFRQDTTLAAWKDHHHCIVDSEPVDSENQVRLLIPLYFRGQFREGCDGLEDLFLVTAAERTCLVFRTRLPELVDKGLLSTLRPSVQVSWDIEE